MKYKTNIIVTKSTSHHMEVPSDFMDGLYEQMNNLCEYIETKYLKTIEDYFENINYFVNIHARIFREDIEDHYIVVDEKNNPPSVFRDYIHCDYFIKLKGENYYMRFLIVLSEDKIVDKPKDLVLKRKS